MTLRRVEIAEGRTTRWGNNWYSFCEGAKNGGETKDSR